MKTKRGMTFIEIMIALCVLAIAMLPIFRMIHKGTEDTDLNASQAYALTKSSEILNTIIDTVPFEVLRGGNPGFLASEDICSKQEYINRQVGMDYAKDMASMLFGDEDPVFPRTETVSGKKQYRCVGRITDLRGITYRTWLIVEDLGDHQVADTPPEDLPFTSGYSGAYNGKSDLFFSFFKNPEKISKTDWSPLSLYNENAASILSTKGARCELELSSGVGKNGMAVPPSGTGNDIYQETDFNSPNQRRYTSRMVCEKASFAAAPENEYSCMKRLLIEVQWNLDRPNFGKPDVTTGNVQRVHLITLKGDIGR